MSDYNSREQGRSRMMVALKKWFGATVSVDYDKVYIYTDDAMALAVAHIWVGHNRMTISFCEAEDIENADVVEAWSDAVLLAVTVFKWLRRMQPDFYEFGE